MRLAIVLIYVAAMIGLLFAKLYIVSGLMLLFAIGFIIYLPVQKKKEIEAVRKRIKETVHNMKEGKETKPFIEINSAPWYIIAELPGVNKETAKHAVQLRKQNGDYPSINVFYQVINVKPIFLDLIKGLAYVKNEKPSLEEQRAQKENAQQ